MTNGFPPPEINTSCSQQSQPSEGGALVPQMCPKHKFPAQKQRRGNCCAVLQHCCPGGLNSVQLSECACAPIRTAALLAHYCPAEEWKWAPLQTAAETAPQTRLLIVRAAEKLQSGKAEFQNGCFRQGRLFQEHHDISDVSLKHLFVFFFCTCRIFKRTKCDWQCVAMSSCAAFHAAMKETE